MLLFGGCIFNIMGGGVRLFTTPPAFHNRVTQHDWSISPRWLLDDPVDDERGSAIVVDLHREYVLCLVSDKPSQHGWRVETDFLNYKISLSGRRTAVGTVTPRTLEVFDVNTGKRTTTHLGPGDAFEWKAAMEHAGTGGGDVKPDFRAMLIERGIALP